MAVDEAATIRRSYELISNFIQARDTGVPKLRVYEAHRNLQRNRNRALLSRWSRLNAR